MLYQLRITSTYVEKTLIYVPLTHCFEDHLHIRGENSTPRIQHFLDVGITSTYVEKT